MVSGRGVSIFVGVDKDVLLNRQYLIKGKKKSGRDMNLQRIRAVIIDELVSPHCQTPAAPKSVTVISRTFKESQQGRSVSRP